MDVDQSEVVLVRMLRIYAHIWLTLVQENLDLYAFSTVAGAHRMSSPPLKAVFRESVVGIRYLHTRSGGASSNQVR